MQGKPFLTPLKMPSKTEFVDFTFVSLHPKFKSHDVLYFPPRTFKRGPAGKAMVNMEITSAASTSVAKGGDEATVKRSLDL